MRDAKDDLKNSSDPYDRFLDQNKHFKWPLILVIILILLILFLMDLSPLQG